MVIPQCASLAHLDLGNNTIRDDGTERLEEVLAQCTSHDHLNLDSIGDDGAARLAAVLQNRVSLVMCVLWVSGATGSKGSKMAWNDDAWWWQREASNTKDLLEAFPTEYRSVFSDSK